MEKIYQSTQYIGIKCYPHLRNQPTNLTRFQVEFLSWLQLLPHIQQLYFIPLLISLVTTIAILASIHIIYILLINSFSWACYLYSSCYTIVYCLPLHCKDFLGSCYMQHLKLPCASCLMPCNILCHVICITQPTNICIGDPWVPSPLLAYIFVAKQPSYTKPFSQPIAYVHCISNSQVLTLLIPFIHDMHNSCCVSQLSHDITFMAWTTHGVTLMRICQYNPLSHLAHVRDSMLCS